MEAARERSRGDGGARAAFLLAWSLAGLSVAIFVASVPLLVLARSAHIPSSWEANLTVGDLFGGVIFLIFPLVGALIASVISLVMRYRRSRGEERQQIKCIAFAASFVGLLYLIAMVCAFIFPSAAWFQAGSPLWLDLLGYAALISFTLVPIAVGFAVLRYRLYEIDIIINRTLVYGSLTISLGLVYVGLVVSCSTSSAP
jgi:hypothetical protein